MPNTVDPMAAVHAERTITELLNREEHLTAEKAAAQIADATEVHFEYRDGQRRLVLATGWEVDPAAHMRSAA